MRVELPLLAPLVMAAHLVLAGPLAAQAPLTVEARGGMLAPIGGFRTGPERGGTLGAGASFGVQFALERSDGRHLYLGFSQHRVDCGDDGCGGEGLYVSTAWDGGLRWDLGSGASVPWIRLGVTIPRVERDRPAPDDADVSELGFGGEAGFGVRFGIQGRFYLSPGVRFGAANAGLPDGTLLRMRYLVADMGVVVGF